MRAEGPSSEVEVVCSNCGAMAAVFRLYEESDGEHRRPRLQRSGFIGIVTRYGGFTESAALVEALRDEDYVEAWRLATDLVLFVCQQCGKPYCQACWADAIPEFDEGYYEDTSATCPQGHRQIVDD